MPPNVPSPYEYKNGDIRVPLDPALFSELPNFIEHGTDNLQKKTEFHVTLLSVEDIILIIGTTMDIRQKDIETYVFGAFTKFVQEQALALESLSQDMRFVLAHDNTSIIVRCTVPHIEELFAAVNALYGIHVPVQPTHVTLYTLQPDQDIPVTSEVRMNEFERVDISAVRLAIANTGISK